MLLSFPKSRSPKVVFWSVFVIGILNRALLFCFNTRSTDDFIEPIFIWIKNGSFPRSTDCWECFQPPLFNVIIKSLSDLLGYSSRLEIFTVIQSVNFVVGGVVLLGMLLFISNLGFSGFLNFSFMLFWAINPEIVSTNVLASNDNFAILAGMMLTFVMVNAIKLPLKKPILLGIALIVGLSAKGNLLVFAPIVLGLILYSFITTPTSVLAGVKLVALISVIVFGSFYFGGYYNKHLSNQGLFAINQDKRPAPDFIKPTAFDGRPGVKSICSAYFTFYYASLFKQPYNNYDFEVFPKHRTSLFTQLFAQYSDYFFERHTWLPPDNIAETLAKNNFVIQLPLLLLFILGVFVGLKESLRNGASETLIYMIIFIGYIGFLVLYTYQYRIFTAMKLIYILPGVYSFIYIFHKGIATIKMPRLVSVLMLASCVIYLSQTFIVAHTLAVEPFVMP